MIPVLRHVILAPPMFTRLVSWVIPDSLARECQVSSLRFKHVVFLPARDPAYEGPTWASLAEIDAWITQQGG